MAVLTVRNLPAEIHQALRLRAAQAGHNTEAEVREILANAVKPAPRMLMGEALAEVGRKTGLTNEDFAILEQARDRGPVVRGRECHGCVNPYDWKEAPKAS